MQLRNSCWGKEAGLHPGSCGHLLGTNYTLSQKRKSEFRFYSFAFRNV